MVAVTKPKSTSGQMEELLRRLLAGVAAPASGPSSGSKGTAEKLLQRLVAERHSL